MIVATLAPPRSSRDWPVARVTQQLLASRLRGERSSRGALVELAHGEAPAAVYARVPAGRTDAAVQGLLDEIAKLSSSPPSALETGLAARALADAFGRRMDTVRSLADLVVQLRELHLGDGEWDDYRAALASVTAAEVSSYARRALDRQRLVVVIAGDADVIEGSLVRFGEVAVKDDDTGATLRTLPKN